MAVTDDFTGTNDTILPTYSANWSVIAPSSLNNCEIRANAVASIGSAGNRYSGRTWANNQYSQGVVVALADQEWAVVVRAATTDTLTLYCGGIIPGQLGHNRYGIWKRVAGVHTQIATHGSQSMAVSDVVRLSIEGTSLTLKVNGIDIVGPSTDSDIAAGQAGIRLHHSVVDTPVLDTWEGDDIGTTPTLWAQSVM